MALTDKLTAIANAIRSKTGKTDSMTLDQMAIEIAKIQNGNEDFNSIIERASTNPTLPDNLTTIGNYAFYCYTTLENISIPDTVASIGTFAFSKCTNLSLSSLPTGLTSIGDNAFYECNKITEITIPAGVTTIGSEAFASCTGLTTVTFKGKPTTMLADIFKYSTNLTTINVPWSEGEVTSAPWGAPNESITINYNYTAY